MKILETRFFIWESDGEQTLVRVNAWVNERPAAFELVYEDGRIKFVVVHITDGSSMPSSQGGLVDEVVVM